VPWTERVNLRALLFIGLVALLVGYPVYQFVLYSVNGGVIRGHDDKGDYLEVDLFAMSQIDLNPTDGTNDSINKEWRALDGKRVALTGEMWLGNRTNGGNSFDLVYSIQKCCFNGPTKVQHFVKCTIPEGKKVDFTSSRVMVIGTLHVGVQRDADSPLITSVYRVDVESVKPAY